MNTWREWHAARTGESRSRSASSHGVRLFGAWRADGSSPTAWPIRPATDTLEFSGLTAPER